MLNVSWCLAVTNILERVISFNHNAADAGRASHGTWCKS
jgi:hypothetical protein